MPNSNPTFVITREDQVVDPVTLTTQALRVGRQIDCEILLNHPSVSSLHAGINEIEGRFYLINLSASHPVTLNGRLIEQNIPEALADGDIAHIGSFILRMNRIGDALNIHVLYQLAAAIVDVVEDRPEKPVVADLSPASPQVADALKEFWDKRTRDKAARPSPLHPRRPMRPGKAQFNWSPTKDLLKAWPISVFIWGTILISAISVMAAFWYAKAFSPGEVSRPHAVVLLTKSSVETAIANKANSNSCTNCHSLGKRMETNCASCHQTNAFNATMTGITAHEKAGIGCLFCHREHQGAEFSPSNEAVKACATCHNDSNTKVYSGHKVGTPHKGTFGYPVVAGKWIWKGLSEDEWKNKSGARNEAFVKAQTPIPGETTDQWRSRQFHVLHLYRVVAREVGLQGNQIGEVSCSTCHKSFDPIDRTTPATTCGRCHNGNTGYSSPNGHAELIDASSPNCVSCHAQHIKAPTHWNYKLLIR